MIRRSIVRTTVLLTVLFALVPSSNAQPSACPFTVTGTSRSATIDAVVLARYALRVTGPALYAGVAPNTPALANAATLIAANAERLDLDGDGAFTPTDAIIILRYLVGFTEDRWLGGLLVASNAKRKLPSEIRDYMNAGCPAPPASSFTTYFVATDGNNTSGDGTLAKPWKTISFGIGKLTGGDTLVVKPGTYVGLENFIMNVPSGTAARPTRVFAQQPMEVRIQSNNSLNYYDNQLRVSGNYVDVDGFIFDMAGTLSPPHIADIEGNFNKITRSIFKRSGNIDAYGGWLYVGGSDNLIEDVAGVGACRYCFGQGGPYALTKRNIWRRIVGRFDYSNASLPKMTMNTYGNYVGDGVSSHLHQNVIAIDGNDVDTGRVNAEFKYASFGAGKASTNVTYYGAIALNDHAAYAGIYASVNGSDNKVVNSIVWDVRGSSTAKNGIQFDQAGTVIERVTIGGVRLSNYVKSGDPGELTPPPPNSALGGTHANLLLNAPGAVVLKQYGVSGTRWGEPGYDQLTNVDLWPWPYQDKIKAVFRETNDVPSPRLNNLPTSNNTKRGFAADGNGLYGGPITLTSYIWEYLGTPCPPSACP